MRSTSDEGLVLSNRKFCQIFGTERFLNAIECVAICLLSGESVFFYDGIILLPKADLVFVAVANDGCLFLLVHCHEELDVDLQLTFDGF